MSTLNIQFLSKDGLWDGALYMGFPALPRRGDLVWLDFPELERGRIKATFRGVEAIHVFESGKGYSARVIVKHEPREVDGL